MCVFVWVSLCVCVSIVDCMRICVCVSCSCTVRACIRERLTVCVSVFFAAFWNAYIYIDTCVCLAIPKQCFVIKKILA